MKIFLPLTVLFFCVSFSLNDSLYPQKADKKTTVAVLEFLSTGGLEKNELATLTNRFRALLVKTQAFQLIERDKMHDILKEQDFIISDNCNTSECVVQVGQLLGVESMVAGDLGKLGETYTIDLRMIDVQSGAVIQSMSRDHTGKIDGLLNVMQMIVNELVETVHGKSSARTHNLVIAATLPASATARKINIMVDGMNVGQNNAKVDLTEGQHKITVTANDTDFTEYRKEINITADQKLDVNLDYSDGYKKRLAAIALAEKQKADIEKAALEKANREKLEREKIEREKQAAIDLEKKQKADRGNGGPSNALLSVALPGLGGYFVEKNKIRPVIATVSAVGLMGFGILQKSKSNDYYSDYKKSTDPDERKSLYKKANSAHHTYYLTTRIGAAIWIADIVWVAYKGMQNKKQTQSASESGFKLNYCDKQIQMGYVIDLPNF